MHKKFLSIGNPKKILVSLTGLINEDQLEILNEEHRRHSKAMFDLGLYHFRFAASLHTSHWRQRVSRLYYGAYNGSKAIRYLVDGSHSTEVSDHKKVGNLPDDFPDHETFGVRLKELREDRNTCDYNHAANAGDLFILQNDAVDLVRNFLRTTKGYLNSRGLDIRNKL